MLKVVESLRVQLTNEDFNSRKQALLKICQSDIKPDEAVVLLEFAKTHFKDYTLDEAAILGLKCIKADPELKHLWIHFLINNLVELKAKTRVVVYKVLHEAITSVPAHNESWITGFGAAFKNEKDPECLEWIFRIIQSAPHISLFPLITVYFPITLRADAMKGEHLKSILKAALKSLSEQNGGEVVFEFLVERMESGSTFAIQDALEYLRDIRVESHWKRMFMLAIKALIDDRFDASEPVQQLLSEWITNSSCKKAMVEYLENEIKTCLLIESSLLATRGVSELIKIFGKFSEMNGIIEYCLWNIQLHPEGSPINSNNKTALLAAMISTDAFKMGPLECYLTAFLNEIVDEQKQVIYRLSVFEAYSRKYKLCREVLTYALDLGSMFLHNSKNQRGKQFVELILCSLIRCNCEMTVEIYASNHTWTRELLNLIYQEECTGKAITEYAMVHGNAEILTAVLQHYKGEKLDGDTCGRFLKMHSSLIDDFVLQKVAFYVNFDEAFDMRVLSWIIFYASREELSDRRSFIENNLSSLAAYPHSMMSICNKMDIIPDSNDIILPVMKALILKGDARGYALFKAAIVISFPNLETIFHLDIDLLNKANFEVHPAYQQKFLANVLIDVNCENYDIWLYIFLRVTDVGIIPCEQAKAAALCNLNGKFMKERIALLMKLGEAPTDEFLSCLDINTMDMQTRIQLIEYLTIALSIVDENVKTKIKRFIESLLDDKKYLVRQAAGKAILAFY